MIKNYTLLVLLPVAMTLISFHFPQGDGDEKMVPTLADLCKKYGSDKCPGRHNFTTFYELYFSQVRESADKVLEIGILYGTSMRLWRDYFEKATIYGMDIIDCSKMDSDRIKTFQGDQGNKDSIQSMVDKFGSDFDIILDDGSHWVSHQQISFGVLFQHLKPGGYYIIEDLHTSLPEFYPYRYDVNEEETNTTLGMLIDYIRTADLASEYLTEYEIEYIMLNAEWVALHHQVGELQSITGVIRKKEVEVVPGR